MNGIPIAKMDREPDNGTAPVERDANAHRLAACWNACQGIPTEMMEYADVKKLIAVAKEACKHTYSNLADADDLTEADNKIWSELITALAPFGQLVSTTEP